MGIEYYLTDHSRKEIFELGKGIWAVLIGNQEYLLYKDSIVKLFEEEIFDTGSNLSSEDRVYWIDVADMIWNFVKDANPNDLEIINDCDGTLYHLKCKRYKFVGSRYDIEKDSLFINDLNKHLDLRFSHLYVEKSSNQNESIG